MKKIVTLTKRREESIQVEVEFPIYRKHDIGGDEHDSVVYTRIDERGQISITKRDFYLNKETQWDIEISPEYTLSGEMDYALGQGEYQLSAEEFSAILEELRQAVGSL